MENRRTQYRSKEKAAAPVQFTAEDLLREAVDRQSTSPQAPKQRFGTLEELHEYQERKRCQFEQIAQLNRLDIDQWICYGSWEVQQGDIDRARNIFERAMVSKQFIKSELETGKNKCALQNRRRMLYEQQSNSSPKGYDYWLEFATMEQYTGNMTSVCNIYDRAIAQVPPVQEKRFWDQYIHVWISYASFLETFAPDLRRAHQIYTDCLKVIPHAKFTFTRIWLLKVNFELRHHNIAEARRTLGQAIALCPKTKFFKNYIALETELKDFGCCRTIYERWLRFDPRDSTAWIRYAALERDLGAIDRARAIFESALSQTELDVPVLVWKAYIEFEEANGKRERVCALYERLLQEAQQVGVWISLALFELNGPCAENEDESGTTVDAPFARAMTIFRRGYLRLRELGYMEDCSLLLQARKLFELGSSSDETRRRVEELLSKCSRKRRRLEQLECGNDEIPKGVEERSPKHNGKRRNVEEGFVEVYQ